MPVSEFIRTTKSIWYKEQLASMFVNIIVISIIRCEKNEKDEKIYEDALNASSDKVNNIIALFDNNEVQYPIVIMSLDHISDVLFVDFAVILCIPDENTEVLRRIGVQFVIDENA